MDPNYSEMVIRLNKGLKCYITGTEVAYLDAPVPGQASQRQLGSYAPADCGPFVLIPLHHGV